MPTYSNPYDPGAIHRERQRPRSERSADLLSRRQDRLWKAIEDLRRRVSELERKAENAD